MCTVPRPAPRRGAHVNTCRGPCHPQWQTLSRQDTRSGTIPAKLGLLGLTRTPKPGPEKAGNQARVTQQDLSLLRRGRTWALFGLQPSPEPPNLKWIWQSQAGARLAAAGEGGRQAGRQLGVVEEPFFPMSLANPIPVSKLRSRSPRRLLPLRESAWGQWAEGKVPSLWQGLGAEGRQVWGREEHSEGSLTPPGWVYLWSHRGLSWGRTSET